MSQSSESEIPSSEKLLSSEFLRIIAIQMVFGVSFATFLLLPKFLRVELEASATEIGLMSGISLVCAAVCSPLVGLAVKRFDKRRLLALALVMEAGGALGFMFVDSVGAFSYALRVLQGIAFVLVFNCTATMVADFLPPRFLARGIGYLGVAMLSTNALAPLFAEPLAEHFGWKTAFGVAGAAGICGLGIVPFVQGVSSSMSDARPTRAFGAQLSAIYFASLLMGVGIGVVFTFVQPFVLEQGAERVGDFFLGYVATAIIARVELGGLADKIGRAKVAIASLAFYAVVTLATSRLTPSLLIVFGAGIGIAHGFLYPALSALGLTLTSSSMRPVFMGWFSCAFNSGFALTALALGPVADRLGYATVFLCAGSAIASGVAPLWWTQRAALRLKMA